MQRFHTFALFFLFAAIAVLARQPGYADETTKDDVNSNAVLIKHKDKVKITAITYWQGWPPEKAIDGDIESSWFTARDDAASFDTDPWIEIELPAAETVGRVTLLGNREKSWPNGYSILEGSLQLLDGDRKQLWVQRAKATGDKHDFDFRPEERVEGVRYIRFRSTSDQGHENQYEDVALGEVLVE